MRIPARFVALVCLVTLSFCVTATEPQAAAPGAKPLLDGMAAMQMSLAALRPSLGDGSISRIEFDSGRGEWRFQVDRGPDKMPPTLVVTLDEATGAVCAHDPASGRCVAEGSAAAQLKQARERRAAMAEAVRHPAPDLQGVMMALVRYQATSKDGYLHANRMPLYVSVSWPEGSREVDLSSDAIHKLADSGLKLFPGSAWPTPKDGRMPAATSMRMSVGLPMSRPDGNYDVQYGFYCGDLCASWHTAVLHHDASGWHVVSSHRDGIS